MSRKFVPEFEVRERRRRAGFVTGYEQAEVELWQIYCRRDGDGQERRATTQDLRRAGYVRKKSGGR